MNCENYFIIGDTHFHHMNIIKYCNRPWNSGKDENGNLIITDDDVSRMNEALINNWNSVVTDSDTVIVDGDFALGNPKKIPSIASRLNGHKWIVLGNHDFFYINDKTKYRDCLDFFYKAGFERVYDHPIILDKFLIVSHEPIEWINSNSVYGNIYAHVHDNPMFKDYTSNTFCCSAERIGYTPIRISEILRKCNNYVGN